MDLEHVEFHEGYGTVDRVDASGLYRRLHHLCIIVEMIGCREREDNDAMKGVRSKNDQRLGTRFFELGGYKIEPLLTNQ